MLDLSRVPLFSLRDGGVACDARGLSVGSVPLLRVAPNGRWSVRPIDEINRDLSACYGLPVDASDKTPALASVARALDAGDLAFAGIAALLLRFPDPPSLEKGALSDAHHLALAEALWRSGLLKDWDPAKHPRTGTPPNRGQFATVSEQQKTPEARRGWPPPIVNAALRNLVSVIKERSPRVGVAALGSIADAAILFFEVLRANPLNEGEDERLAAQWNANLDPPKTLEELQQPPSDNVLGYEQHHIVEQNEANIAKRELEKFGQATIDDASNLVWVPRLKHEQITSYYNSKPDPSGPTQREIVNQLDWNEQRAIGLDQLRATGVLQ
jgi:hypothetical protein